MALQSMDNQAPGLAALQLWAKTHSEGGDSQGFLRISTTTKRVVYVPSKMSACEWFKKLFGIGYDKMTIINKLQEEIDNDVLMGVHERQAVLKHLQTFVQKIKLPLEIDKKVSAWITKNISNEQLIDAAVTRLNRCIFQRCWTRERMKKVSASGASQGKETASRMKYEIFSAKIETKRAFAAVSLKKRDDEVSDEEIASYYGISIHEFRAQKIAQACGDLAENMTPDQLSVTPFIPLHLPEVANYLQIDQKTLRSWMRASEEQLQKEERLAALSHQTITSKSVDVESLTTVCQDIEGDVGAFARPSVVIDLYRAGLALNPLKTRLDALLTDLLSHMAFIQRKTLWQMAQSAVSPLPEGLREKVAGVLWGIHGEKEAISTPWGGSSIERVPIKHAKDETTLSPIELVSKTLKEAEELKNKVNTAIAQDAYDVNMFSGEIQKFVGAASDKWKERLTLVSQKLDNVIARQKLRLEKLKANESVTVPLFFHGTPEVDTAFCITASGIRPQQATYFGAFISTQPAMLRYGPVIVGLGQEHVFTERKRYVDPKVVEDGLYLPDDLPSGLNANILRDKKLEKWISFSEFIGLNGNEQAFRKQFFDGFAFAISEQAGTTQLSKQEQSKLVADCLQVLKKTWKVHFEYDKQNQSWVLMRMKKEKTKTTYEPLTVEILLDLLKEHKLEAKKEDLLQNINLMMPTQMVAGTITIAEKSAPCLLVKQKSTTLPRPVATPCFIAPDSDLLDYFVRDENYQALMGKQNVYGEVEQKQQMKNRSIDVVREKFKEAFQSGASSSAEEDKKRKQDVDLHCIPLFEQLLEFDINAKVMGGIIVRQDWFSVPLPVQEKKVTMW